MIKINKNCLTIEFLLVLNINLVNKCSVLVYISQLVRNPTIQSSDCKRDNKPVIWYDLIWFDLPLLFPSHKKSSFTIVGNNKQLLGRSFSNQFYNFLDTFLKGMWFWLFSVREFCFSRIWIDKWSLNLFLLESAKYVLCNWPNWPKENSKSSNLSYFTILNFLTQNVYFIVVCCMVVF